ncbi:MAG: hypothetical protein JW816_01460 [Candidatus Buchananbacteria bacterium]|nr:hypothetical protein [Candidatus Buchananbacteria bacterium]
MKMKKIIWEKAVTRELSLSTTWYPNTARIDNFKSFFGWSQKNLFTYHSGGLAVTYIDQKDNQKLLKHISRVYSKSPNLIKLLNDFEKIIKIRDQLAREIINKNFFEIDKKILALKFKAFHLNNYKCWSYHLICFYLLDAIDKKSLTFEKVKKQYERIRKIHPYQEYEEKLLPYINKYVARKQGVDYKLLFYLMPPELLSYLQAKTIINIDELKNRKKAYLLIAVDGKNKLYSGQTARKKFNQLNIERQELSAQIKGMIAQPGTVTAKARVVTRKSDFSDFKKGEVLIAHMTTPEYVPLMKKASAVVTDEGGIGCHAAIISRELKKPCIIGTKNATDLIKNGDLIKVDATTGTVEVVKK